MPTLIDKLREEKVSESDIDRVEMVLELFSDWGLTLSEPEKDTQCGVCYRGNSSTNTAGFSVAYDVHVNAFDSRPQEEGVASTANWIRMYVLRNGKGFIDFSYSLSDCMVGFDERGLFIPPLVPLETLKDHVPDAKVKIHLRHSFPNAYDGDPVLNVDVVDLSGIAPEAIEVEGFSGTLEDRIAKLHLLGKGWNLAGYDKDFDGMGCEPDTYHLDQKKGIRDIPFLVTSRSNTKKSAFYTVARFGQDDSIQHFGVSINKKQYEAQPGFDSETAYAAKTIASLDNNVPGVTVETLDKRLGRLKAGLKGKKNTKNRKLVKAVFGLEKFFTGAGIKDHDRTLRLLEGLQAMDRIVTGYDDARALLATYKTALEQSTPSEV